MDRARLLHFVIVALLAVGLSETALAASCTGLSAPSPTANSLTGVIYDPVSGVMKACVGSSWVALSAGGGGGGGGGGASVLDDLGDVSLSGLSSGQVLSYDGSGWSNQTLGMVAEVDPKVGLLTASKWCAANSSGNAIDCTQDAPSGGAGALGSLSDVSVSSPSDGEILTFNGTNWTNVEEADPKIGALSSGKWCTTDGTTVTCTENAPPGVSTLAGLSDVNTTGIGNGKSLVYNSTTSKWEPQTVSSGGASAMSGLSDVSLSSPASGQVLTYDGTDWTNSATPAETDPKVGLLTAGKWCSTNGTTVTCTEDAPAGVSTLASLTDVSTAGIANGKALVYNSTSSKWEPQTISTGGTVSGTTGRIAKFTGVAAVGDSVLSESSGNVGIGTTSPGQKLTVTGTIESTSGGIKFPDGTTQTTAAGASSLPSGTHCGLRFINCVDGGTPQYGISVSCAGATLSGTCGYSGGGGFVTGASGCPSGFTARVMPADGYTYMGATTANLVCTKD